MYTLDIPVQLKVYVATDDEDFAGYLGELVMDGLQASMQVLDIEPEAFEELQELVEELQREGLVLYTVGCRSWKVKETKRLDRGIEKLYPVNRLVAV